MNTSKIVWLASLLAPLTVSGGQLSTDYATEGTLRIERETTVFLETIDFAMERNGEPIESRGGFGGGDVELMRTVVQLDRVVAHEDGVPTEVERTFESVSGEDVYAGEGRSLDAPLDGVTLALALDDDGEVVAEATEGSVGAEQLEGHELTLALDALLPDEEVTPGDSWEVEAESFMHALGLDLEQALFPLPEQDERGGGEGGRSRSRGGPRPNPFARVARGATWDVTARLADETVELDGVECLVIELEAEGSGVLEDPVRFGGGRGRSPGLARNSRAAFETEFQIDLRGQLYFAQSLSRPVQLSVDGTFELEQASAFEREDTTLSMFRLQEGTFEQTVAVSSE